MKQSPTPKNTHKKQPRPFFSPFLMKKQPAFTLTELMITMAIIAILATSGILAYADYTKKGRDTARAQIAQNLNSSVMAYAASNEGNPPGPTEFEAFLASAGETFGGGISGGGLSLVDPVGGKDVCLDATGAANQPCRFDYTAYDDGTYAISYGVEHKSSTEENFYKTAISTTDPIDPNKAIVKYGVSVGSAPYIGSPSTKADTTQTQADTKGVDEEYTPSGETTSRSLVVDFRPQRLDIVSGSSGSTSSGGITCGVTNCNAGQGCVGGVCVNACGASDNYCGVDQLCDTDNTCKASCGSMICVTGKECNNNQCVDADPCTLPGVQAGNECADGTVYVTPTLRTTKSDAGQYVWAANNVATGAKNTSDGRDNIAKLKTLNPDLSAYPAARVCEDSVANNKTDWYLPAKSELNDLYLAKNSGVLNNSFDTTGVWPGSQYKSSTELMASWAWSQYFDLGTQGVSTKSYSISVRCVRRP